ncbi:Zinc finger/binuclear cluster transcriptional regulator [Mycena kentingensis (nom. inval.)]|nr:Zinc finger/binuclear cluster transcriptional regulator [Mycena kentingensis (nom. inval.)]
MAPLRPTFVPAPVPAAPHFGPRTPATGRTNVCTAGTSLPGGASVYPLPTIPHPTAPPTGLTLVASDLLSRHVNKCHAGASPKVSAAGGRRKGSTAAARATTSKQACDQCVQSSLPCDGSNPCTKCVTRKTRCTFVKFHRQTAPVGPGHASSLSASHPSSLSSSASGSTYSLDGGATGSRPFLYAQSAASGGGTGPFAFDAGPPGPSPTISNRDGISQPQFAFSHPGSYGDYRDRPDYGDYDYSDGYASSDYSSQGSRPPSTPFRLSRRHHLHFRYGPTLTMFVCTQEYGSYHEHHIPALDGHGHGLDLHQADFSNNAFGLMSLNGHAQPDNVQQQLPVFSTSPVSPHQHVSMGVGVGGMAPPDVPPMHGHGHGHHDHRLSLPPLPPAPSYSTSSAGPSPVSASFASGGTTATSAHPQGQGQAPPQTPGETRELREFWKAYMRTPLTGPGLDPLGLKTPSASAAAAAAAAHAGGILGGATPTAGGGGGRLYRVSSMPSVKTPRVEEEYDLGVGRVQGFGALQQPQVQAQAQAQAQAQVQAQLPPKPGEEGEEDLQSYEAAVMARKAPELVLRKPAKMKVRRPVTSHGSSSGSVSGVGGGGGAALGFDFNAIAARDRNRERERSVGSGGGGSRPGTSSGQQSQSQSSLAGAFGAHTATFGSSPSASSPSPAMSHTSSTDSLSGISAGLSLAGDVLDAERPSFKRLPSQALEPEGSKRMRPGEVVVR